MATYVKRKQPLQQVQQVQRQRKNTTDQRRSHVQLDQEARPKDQRIDRQENRLKSRSKSPLKNRRENHDHLVDSKLVYHHYL